MSEILSLPVEVRDIAYVAVNMREADVLEIMASGGQRPAEALVASCAASALARSLFIGGDLCAIFGVLKLFTVAVPWALTTTDVERHPVDFWRASKIVLAEMRKSYPSLVQCIDARHVMALKWALRLGFDTPVDQDGNPLTHTCGVEKLPFHQISMRS